MKAIDSVRKPPCVAYGCINLKTCEANKVACERFSEYVNKGTLNVFADAVPKPEIYNRIFSGEE